MDVTIEEENKILRAALMMNLWDRGIQLSNSTRHNLCHLAKEIGIPKEKVLKVAEQVTLEFVKDLFNPQRKGH